MKKELPLISRVDALRRSGDMAGARDLIGEGLKACSAESERGQLLAAQGRVDLDMGSPRFTFATQSSEHGGSGTLTAEISGDGVVIPIGADVTTDFDLGLHTGILTFDIFPTQLASSCYSIDE